jgi:hypothetical protein
VHSGGVDRNVFSPGNVMTVEGLDR